MDDIAPEAEKGSRAFRVVLGKCDLPKITWGGGRTLPPMVRGSTPLPALITLVMCRPEKKFFHLNAGMRF